MTRGVPSLPLPPPREGRRVGLKNDLRADNCTYDGALWADKCLAGWNVCCCVPIRQHFFDKFENMSGQHPNAQGSRVLTEVRYDNACTTLRVLYSKLVFFMRNGWYHHVLLRLVTTDRRPQPYCMRHCFDISHFMVYTNRRQLLVLPHSRYSNPFRKYIPCN
jgi:hypothetical protein